jgi:hypothetical protein
MMNFDDFRKANSPSHRESEQEYFLRLTSKYRRLAKIEKRAMRLNRLTQQLNAIAKRLIVMPNLLHVKSA